MQLSLTSTNIWVADKAVDFRKSIDGLSEIIYQQFEKQANEGVYIFYNRSKDKLKVLAWHGNGYVLLYKRLEEGKFQVSAKSDGLMQIDAKQLSWMLAGLDWVLMSKFNTLNYDNFY